MKLLDSQQVADKKEKQNDDQLKRIVQLNEAENQAVIRMNKAIKEDEDKRGLIEAEICAYKASQAIVRDNLEKEVTSLEKRRVDALKPVNELKKEAESILKENKDAQGNLASLRESLQEEEERLSIIAEDLADKAGLLMDNSEDLQNREKGIKQVEEKLRISTDKLSQDWKHHHKVVHEVNADLKQRELVLKVGMETIAVNRAEIKADKADIADDRRAVKDGYESLARAQEEILNKNYGKRKKR